MASYQNKVKIQMENDAKFPTIAAPVLICSMGNEREEQRNAVGNDHDHLSLFCPEMFPLTSLLNADVNVGHYNIDNICLSPSPLETRPRLFQAGSIFNSETYQQILYDIYHQQKIQIKEEEEEEEEEEENNNSDNKQTLDDDISNQAVTTIPGKEIERLSQLIIRELPTSHNEVAHILLNLLDIVDTKTTTAAAAANVQDVNNMNTDITLSDLMMSSHPYTPMNQTGVVHDHDRPYADYGHLDARTIAEECNFHLDMNDTEQEQSMAKRRLSAKSFAITSWTNVSKKIVMDEIKRQFGIERIQYVCVAKELSEITNKTHLHIQIILKDKGSKRRGFLDRITNTHCNYQVTDNDRAWNAYIKKGCDYIEFGSFKSTTKRAVQYWPSQLQSSSNIPLSLHSTITDVNLSLAPLPITTTTMTVGTRGGRRTAIAAAAAAVAKEEKQRQKEAIARHAFDLAKNNVNDALIFMRDNSVAIEFLRYASWYKNTFILIYLLEQYEISKSKKYLKIVYKWPKSFPDCTSTLREVVDRWLREEFHRTSRAKCLILIGPSGTGKTTFAKSLPGKYAYFKGRWSLSTWNDSADYLIFDDIDWDRFEELGFPMKKDLFTQNGITITTDKYEKTREINVTQPAIILLNPGRPEGALGRQVVTFEDQCEAIYWQRRATIYRMGPHDYFYKLSNHQHYSQDNMDNQMQNNSLYRIHQEQHIDRTTDVDHDNNVFDELIQRSRHVFH